MSKLKPILESLPEENNRLLSLCFCSIVLTCLEVKTAENLPSFSNTSSRSLEIIDLPSVKGVELEDDDGLEYMHMPRIPANIARIFWNELLDLGSSAAIRRSMKDLSKKEETTRTKRKNKLRDDTSKGPRKDSYWKEFITEEERNKFLNLINSQKSRTLVDYADLRKQLLSNIENNNSADSYSVSSKVLTEFFQKSLHSVCKPPSNYDLMLIHDEFFHFIRDKLMKSNVISVAVKERTDDNFLHNQMSYEEIEKFKYFLDEQFFASLKEFFNPEISLEYLIPAAAQNTALGPLEGLSRSPHQVLRRCSTSMNSTYEGYDVHPMSRKSKRRVTLDNYGANIQNSNYAKCLRMIKLTREEGGFALSILTKEEQFKRNNHFPTTFEIWNLVMAKSCLKLYLPEYSSSFSLRSAIVAINAQYFGTHRERKLKLEQSTSFKDETLSYVLKMLPSHLMRAKRVSDAMEVLQSYDFLFSRIVVLGVDEGSRLVRQDCEEIRLRLTKKLDAKRDVNSREEIKSSIVGIFEIFKKYFLEDMATVAEVDKLNQGRVLHNIGCSLERMSWVDEALKFYRSSLECKREVALPPKNSIVNSLSSISNALLACKKYEEGLNVLEEKLELQKKMPNNHHDIAKTLKSMAVVYGMQGDYKACISNYEEILDMEQNILGGDKIEVYETLNQLGLIYIVVEEFEDAYRCFEETLPIAKLIFGKSHSHVARAHHNLGRTLAKLEQYSEAIYHFSKALSWRRKYLPDLHEDLAKSLYALGSAYVRSDNDPKNIEKAIICLEEALKITRIVYGAENEEVGRRLIDLALAYDKYGQFYKAVETKVEIIHILKTNYGHKHESVGEAVMDLGLRYKTVGHVRDALLCFEEVQDIFDSGNVFDSNFESKSKPKTAYRDLLHHIGASHFILQSYDSAAEYYDKSYRLRIQELGKEHIDVADSQNCLGATLLQLGNEDKALKLLNLALKNRKSLLGKKDEKVADTLYNIALAHISAFDYSLSISCSTEAHRIREHVFGRKHEKVADTKYLIATILTRLGEFSHSLRFFKDALLIYRKIGYEKNKPKVVQNTNDWIGFVNDKLKEKKSLSEGLGRKFVPMHNEAAFKQDVGVNSTKRIPAS